VETRVALIAAVAALLGALIGGVAVWASTAYVQRRQDRREKRQRVHSSFQRVLLAANSYAALTSPFQRGSDGGAWTPEQDMSEEYRRRFNKTLEEVAEGLRNAAVDLTLEGLMEPVDRVKEMAVKFDAFRWHRESFRLGAATEEAGEGLSGPHLLVHPL